MARLSFGLLAFLVAATPVDAASLPGAARCESAACVADTSGLLAGTEKLSLLKGGVARFPGDPRLRLLLAATYLEMDNPVWAIRSLNAWLAEHPNDCEARTWLAWAQVRLGATGQTLQHLPLGVCKDKGPLETRADLLRALLHVAEENPEAAQASFDRAWQRPEAYKGARDALPTIKRLVSPHGMDELSWRMEFLGGYTTNPRAGAPTDPTADDSVEGSGLGQFNGWLRLSPDLGAVMRPALEAQVRTLGFEQRDARDFSYVNLTGRVGALFDWDMPRLLLAYRPDFLLLASGDSYSEAPLWYVGSHRGELEAEIAPWLILLGGAGKRDFRERGRTRLEVDGGVAGSAPLGSHLRLLWAGTARWHRANEQAYDLVGGTTLLNLGLRLPHGYSTRAALVTVIDSYPESEGFFDSENRFDLMFKGTLAGWTPSWRGFQFGLAYELAERSSSASAYSFTEHRFSLRIRLGGRMDFGGPELAPEGAKTPLPWGFGGAGPADDRVQDLLRMDEQVENVCGCGG